MKKTDKLFEDITSNQTLFIETSSNAKTFIKQIETIIFILVIVIGLIGNLMFIIF